VGSIVDADDAVVEVAAAVLAGDGPQGTKGVRRMAREGATDVVYRVDPDAEPSDVETTRRTGGSRTPTRSCGGRPRPGRTGGRPTRPRRVTARAVGAGPRIGPRRGRTTGTVPRSTTGREALIPTAGWTRT
jgi:hypothetical protein